MADESEFFRLRKEAKTYISKLFNWNERDSVGKRNVTIVIDGTDEMHLGEIEGALCLRLTGQTRRTQVTALVTQDDKAIRKVTLETFKHFGGSTIFAQEKDCFTFRSDEFERLVRFLANIQFINLENQERFQIEDISTEDGPKVLIDAAHRNLVEEISGLPDNVRSSVLQGIANKLSSEDVNLLLGRRQGFQEFQQQMENPGWAEKDWQDFFERNDWVFGYGLDYRFSVPFDREMTVGAGGTDNREKPIVDFLRTFSDYTVLVEIKRPEAKIFGSRGGRAGTRSFSREFIDAVSQVLEQKAEWIAFANRSESYSKDGSRKLDARTKNSKTVLVYGSSVEFSSIENPRDRSVALDTFELFRSEKVGVEILTFDELLKRAKFIVDR